MTTPETRSDAPTDDSRQDQQTDGSRRDRPTDDSRGEAPAAEPGRDRPTDEPRYEVPTGETPERCRYCRAPLPDEETRTLHVGLEHPNEMSDAEREAFRERYAAEDDRLRSFQLRALLALVLLYFGFLFAYALFA